MRRLSVDGPRELTLYVTGACDASCAFCHRTIADVHDGGTMRATFVRDLLKRSIEGNKAATAMAEKEGHPVTVLGRFITARKAMQLLNQKIPEYARLSKNMKAGPSEAEVDEAVKSLLRKLGIQL